LIDESLTEKKSTTSLRDGTQGRTDHVRQRNLIREANPTTLPFGHREFHFVAAWGQGAGVL
jgi:hypothetical protein